ncbi:MAG TPA: hypothetical protein VGB23_00465 [Nitrospirota bacterium]
MRRKYLLFVTYQHKQSEEGLAYAVQLAKTLGKGLSVLMVKEKKGLAGSFSDAMAAVAFAEAGEHETAKEMMAGNNAGDASVKGRALYIEDKCRTSGVDVDIKTSDLDAATAIKGSLSGDGGIDMILLGPNVTETENFTARRLAKLIRTATMPIVTIARQTCAA